MSRVRVKVKVKVKYVDEQKPTRGLNNLPTEPYSTTIKQSNTCIHALSFNSLLQSTERLAHLAVYLLKLARNVLFTLRVGRLKLHLRQLEHDVGSGIANLVKVSLFPDSN